MLYKIGADFNTIWELKLGGDGSDIESVGGFPLSGGLVDCGNYGSAHGGRKLRVLPGG